MLNKRKTSLNLLNEKALNEAFSVEIFVNQKFIKTNEDKPINSHPRKKFIKLLEIN